MHRCLRRSGTMIHVNGLKISLDKREQGSDFDFISHAHSDHVSAAKSSKNAIASSETKDLINAAYGIDITLHGGNGFELLDSGHMLGSKQLYINDMGDGRSLNKFH